jgi:membrane-bound ClpP family serine protease
MTPLGFRNPFGHRRTIWPWLSFCLALAILPVQAADVDPDPKDAPASKNLAGLVRVQLPLTGSADQALQTTIRRVRDELVKQSRLTKDSRRPLLVLQLDARPQNEEAGDGSQFERAFALARFLCSREMAGVKIVAFIPRTLNGHGVLLALASEEIVMAPEAMIGNAGADEATDESLRQTLVAAYREIAETRLTLPVAIAVAMIDPTVEVLQVEAEDGTHFLTREEFEKFAADHEIVEEKVLVPAGTLAEFDGREGRRFGFVKYLASTRDGLATALNVSADALVENESLASEWRPVVIDINGELTPKLASRMETLLGAAVQHQGANWICVRIDSAGGDLEAGIRMASALARLDANSIRTVAYVPSEASGAAALVALSCDQLAMHPTARLSSALPVVVEKGKPRIKNRPLGPEDAQLAAAVQSIRQSLAPRTDYTWSLLAKLVDPNLELAQYQNKATGEVRLMSPTEQAEQADAVNWQQAQVFSPKNERLVLDGQQAHERGIAWHTVDTFDELKQQFGLTGEVPNPQPNLALEFIEALATPELAIILLMVGFAGIYIEFRTPGVGLGAFVGAVALLLFFWSKYLDGTAGWLEALLFVAGLSFVMLEVFVLPGFGIFGLGGGAMMLASLVLASLTFVRPHSEVELEELARSVGTVALSGLGVMAFILISRRYLPQAPLFRNIVLEPPVGDELNELGHRESVADFSALIGAKGYAATDLRPAGKARINHELVDVIAEAEPLDNGTPIVVIETRGNRIVVRSAR